MTTRSLRPRQPRYGCRLHHGGRSAAMLTRLVDANHLRTTRTLRRTGGLTVNRQGARVRPRCARHRLRADGRSPQPSQRTARGIAPARRAAMASHGASPSVPSRSRITPSEPVITRPRAEDGIRPSRRDVPGAGWIVRALDIDTLGCSSALHERASDRGHHGRRPWRGRRFRRPGPCPSGLRGRWERRGAGGWERSTRAVRSPAPC